MSDGGSASGDPLAGLRVERSSPVPPWRQIATYVHDAVISGRLPHGMVLPAERGLAKELGVSRSTVARALSELADTGLLERRVGYGTVVAFDTATWQVGATDGIPWQALLTALAPAPLRDEAESERPDGAGSRLWAEAARLGGGDDRGLDSIVLVNDVDLAARFVLVALVPAGARVVVVTSAPPSVILSLRMRGAELVALPRRTRSANEALEALLLDAPATRLIDLSPSNGYAGLSQPSGERAHCLGLAKHHGVPVLEDARFAGTEREGIEQSTLLQLEPHDHVVQIGQFEAAMPGGGAAWISAPTPLLEQLRALARMLNVALDARGAAAALSRLQEWRGWPREWPERELLLQRLTTSGLAARPDCGRGLWLSWPARRSWPAASLGLRVVPASQFSVRDEHRDEVWLDLDAPLEPGQAERIAGELIALATDGA